MRTVVQRNEEEAVDCEPQIRKRKLSCWDPDTNHGNHWLRIRTRPINRTRNLCVVETSNLPNAQGHAEIVKGAI